MHIKNQDLFFERYTIAIYFVATFLVTIILGATYQFTNNPFISPQYAPTIGIAIICVVSKDWSIWKGLFWNAFKKPKNVLLLFLALLLPIVVILLASLIMSFLGTKFSPWQDTTPGYIITIIITILGCIFEEVGWRGYLLPKFKENYSMLNSAIGVGLIWGIWHCRFTYGILGFLLFVILIICFSVLMAWIYMKTKGNLWYMILFHFGVNIGSVTLLQNKEGVLFYSLAIIICLLICIPLVIRNKNEFLTKSP